MKKQRKESFKIEADRLGIQDLDRFVLDPTIDWENVKMAFVAGGQGGGKIAAEFCRLGYPLIAYNTSKEDLKDLENMINQMPEENRGRFKTIHLPGEGGASKDRDLGHQAIKDNLDLLEEEMVDDEDIANADFVWLVLTLGGGTGNGSLSLVSRILGLIREDKKIIRGGIEKASIGIIAALPDERKTKSKIAVNVALAIKEIEEMHDNLEIGSVILIDNKKLLDDFNEKYMGKNTDKEWSEDGNAKVARIVTETALLTNLSGSEVLDKSELLDIWSSPGYLNLGKRIIKEDWLKKYLEGYKNSKTKDAEVTEGVSKYVNVSVDKLTLTQKGEIFAQLVKDSFEDNIFVSGLDLDAAIHGGMFVMTDGKVIDTKEASTLELVLTSEVLESDAVENPHYGFIKNDKYIGTVRHPKDKDEDKKDGRIFTMCVTYTPPKYILNWFEKAKEKRDLSGKKITKLNERKSELAKLVAGLDASSSISKKSNDDIASSLSKLISSDRGVKPKTSETKQKISLKSLIKESNVEKDLEVDNKAVSKKDALAAQIREKMNKQN